MLPLSIGVHVKFLLAAVSLAAVIGWCHWLLGSVPADRPMATFRKLWYVWLPAVGQAECVTGLEFGVQRIKVIL